ncbi:MAG TPA: SprB repeat-containing protein, partial [Flavobacteriales bacterium]|nr:SprB repeat-containing protein [Flavobacteriales bacterium]
MRTGTVLISLLLVNAARALSLTFNVTPPTCSYANGSVLAIAQGGVGPYTYLWGGGETTGGLINLVAGDYTLTVTDFLGAQVTETASLVAQDYLPIMDYQHVYCPGQVYHGMFSPQGPNGTAWDPQYAPYTTS